MSGQGALSKGLAVLSILAEAPEGLPLMHLAELLETPKSGAHRTLQNLIVDGYVRQDAMTGNYQLTLALPILGMQFLSTNSLTSLALPLLESLADDTGQLVRLALAEDDRLVWVAKRQGARSGLRFDPDHAAEVPLVSTATGVAWLSRLPEEEAMSLALRRHVAPRHETGPNLPASVSQILETLSRARSQGWASVHDSYELGISAVAKAVVDRESGRPLGAVSIAGPTVQLTPERVQEVLPLLAEVVSQLEKVPRAMLPTMPLHSALNIVADGGTDA
nr:IclR family transcriptional regulator [Mycetocola zhujimingii]